MRQDHPLRWTSGAHVNGTIAPWPSGTRRVQVQLQLQGCSLYALELVAY